MNAGEWITPGTGTSLSHAEVIKRASAAPAVLLGETHDRADIHRWQMHVAAGIMAHRRDIVLGFEMFPARLNPVLAQWIAGDLDEDTFLTRVEWTTVWNFPPELYMPLFRFCRDFGIEMIGLNCRRGLVSEVGKLGWDAIDAPAREGLTPSAPATAAYRRFLFNITGGVREGREAQSADDPAFDRFVRAQQTWDRAFACRIADRIAAPDAPLVIGIIGRGHLEFRGGTPFQLGDLGIDNAAVLLPVDKDAPHYPDQADALCYMPTRLPG
ncbi:ChaN family lipoprotein [Roseovarius aestuarii]|nr:ChaN family lipoprotein [Roseovarius aestuarii]